MGGTDVAVVLYVLVPVGARGAFQDAGLVHFVLSPGGRERRVWWGDVLGFDKNWTANSEQMCPIYRAGAQNLASHYSPADFVTPAKVAYGPQLATP